MATVRVIYCSKNLSRTRPRYVSSPRFQSSRKPSSLPRRNSESVRKFLARAIVLTVFEQLDRRFSAILEQATILQFLRRRKKIFAPSPNRTTREKSERRGGGGFRSVWKWKKCVILSAVSLDTVFPRCTGTGSSLSPFRPFYFGFT